ncbi:hypothetical protein AX14_011879 [Amanita brunnescens Koide BX004]|nr:hypothetical protein AX14_011879 [Amanita brunnescens Koide BX004]
MASSLNIKTRLYRRLSSPRGAADILAATKDNALPFATKRNYEKKGFLLAFCPVAASPAVATPPRPNTPTKRRERDRDHCKQSPGLGSYRRHSMDRERDAEFALSSSLPPPSASPTPTLPPPIAVDTGYRKTSRHHLVALVHSLY